MTYNDPHPQKRIFSKKCMTLSYKGWRRASSRRCNTIAQIGYPVNSFLGGARCMLSSLAVLRCPVRIRACRRGLVGGEVLGRDICKHEILRCDGSGVQTAKHCELSGVGHGVS